MSTKRILFATGEGIGNVIQCAPVLRTIKENLDIEIDFWHVFGSFAMREKIFPYVDNWHAGNRAAKIADLFSCDYYQGVVVTFWMQSVMGHRVWEGANILNEIMPLDMHRSEVDTNMDIARDLGIPEDKLIYEAECNYNEVPDHFDVVIANGYNRSGKANWSIKGYPYYEMVVELLTEQGVSVCSIGAGNEYIAGTENRTGLNLLDSFGIVKNAKCLLANDSGMYHAANALKTPNIVLFTATSIDKNYDKRFHKYTEILGRDDLKCRPCQASRRWNKDCTEWKCQYIDPTKIFNAVMGKLDEHIDA